MDSELITFISFYILTYYLGANDAHTIHMVKKHVRAFINSCQCRGKHFLASPCTDESLSRELTMCAPELSFVNRLSVLTKQLEQYSERLQKADRPTRALRAEVLAEWIAVIPARLRGCMANYYEHAATFANYYDLCREDGSPLALARQIRPWIKEEGPQGSSAQEFLDWICLLQYRINWQLIYSRAPLAARRHLRFKPPHKFWQADIIDVRGL